MADLLGLEVTCALLIKGLERSFKLFLDVVNFARLGLLIPLLLIRLLLVVMLVVRSLNKDKAINNIVEIALVLLRLVVAF